MNFRVALPSFQKGAPLQKDPLWQNDSGSSCPLSISLCFHVYNHIVLPSPTSLLFPKHYFCFCLPVSILLSLLCSLSLSPFLGPLLAVWTLSAALTSLFFLIRLLSYTLYFAIHPIPSHTHTHLPPPLPPRFPLSTCQKR